MDLHRFEVLNDAYITALEDTKEPEVVKECEHCMADLYEGEEVVVDGQNVFCDFRCGKEFHGIKDTDSVPNGSNCAVCGEYLSEEYDAFINNDGEYFCSMDCAEQMAGLKFETLWED